MPETPQRRGSEPGLTGLEAGGRVCGGGIVCVSSSLASHMMYSGYKLNKQVTIQMTRSLDVLLSQFGTSVLFDVLF